jgi:SH3 domain-containing protein
VTKTRPDFARGRLHLRVPRCNPPRSSQSRHLTLDGGGRDLPALADYGRFMGELKLKPQTNILALKVTRAWQGEANGTGEAKVNGHRSGATEASLELTPQRLELVKAYARHALRHAQAPSASQIAQRFAPRAEDARPAHSGAPHPVPQPPQAPLFALASGIRRLTAVLVVAALLPNLTLAAFWLRLIEPPWSRAVMAPAVESHASAARPEPTLPVLSAPARIEAAAGEDVLLPIALDGTDGVPAGSVIVIRGLPPGSTLSNGRPDGETAWAVRPDEIGDLHLIPARAASSEAVLTIQLLAPNNGILADAATIFKVTADETAAIADTVGETEEAAANAPEEIEVAAAAPRAATTDDPVSPPETVPLPTRRPSPDDDGTANWVRPSAYVNLRDGPSSTARVVSVVAKGAKLRIVTRKRGWVQVADPATSQTGWIYSGHTETVP